MKKPVYISSVALFTINTVRSWRLTLGLTQREVSSEISPGSDSNTLGIIENNFRTEKYTDKHLNKIAQLFTKTAHEIGLIKEFSLFTFYPEQPIEELMVEKKIVQRPKELTQTSTLFILLEEKQDPFFNDWHTVAQIAAHCSAYSGKNWTNNDFTAVIKTATQKNKLERKSETESIYRRHR